MSTEIERMSGVKIKSEFFNTAPIWELYPPRHRVALLYGKNGCGKTTVAQGFRQYKNGAAIPRVELTPTANNTIVSATPGQPGKFCVFDEDYVASMVKLKDVGMDAIVLFGVQIDLEAEISQNQTDINSKLNEIVQQTDECTQFVTAANVASPDHWIGMITTELGKEDGWARYDADIRGNPTKSRIPQALNRIGQLSPDKPKEEIRQQFDEHFRAFKTANTATIKINTPVATIRITDGDCAEQAMALLAKAVDRPQWTEREQRIFKLLGGGGLDSVKTFLSDAEHTICDRCLQPISEDYRAAVIKELEHILNREVEELKGELRKLIVPETAATVYEAYRSLPSYGGMRNLLDEYYKAAVSHNAAIQAKIDNPFDSMIYDDTIGVMVANQSVNQVLTVMEANRVFYNYSIEERGTVERELIAMNDALAHYAIKDMYVSLQAQRAAKTAADERLVQCQIELEALKARETELDNRRKNFELAAEDINHSLEYIFYCQGRLKLELYTDGYYHLKVNGHNVPPNKVSCGERNALALSYFFTEVARNANTNAVYTDEVFLVIDDPVSSFDFENRIGVQSLLRWKLGQVLEGCATSKVLVMTHDIGTAFDLEKGLKEIKERLSGTAKAAEFKLWQLEDCAVTEMSRDKRNEYTLLLRRIFEYAKTGVGDSLVIGNIMRRVLEAFATFSFKEGIENITAKDSILAILPDANREYYKNFMYRLVLHGESHYEEQIQGMRDYCFSQFLSDDEKKRTAQGILCLMYELNKHHILAHLTTGVEPDIICWIASISHSASPDEEVAGELAADSERNDGGEDEKLEFST